MIKDMSQFQLNRIVKAMATLKNSFRAVSLHNDRNIIYIEANGYNGDDVEDPFDCVWCASQMISKHSIVVPMNETYKIYFS